MSSEEAKPAVAAECQRNKEPSSTAGSQNLHPSTRLNAGEAPQVPCAQVRRHGTARFDELRFIHGVFMAYAAGALVGMVRWSSPTSEIFNRHAVRRSRSSSANLRRRCHRIVPSARTIRRRHRTTGRRPRKNRKRTFIRDKIRTHPKSTAAAASRRGQIASYLSDGVFKNP